VKRFVTRVINGENRPRAIVFQDEIEKSLAGAAGDLSGTTQELLGSQLTFMQDKNATGLLFIGHPGAAKSAIAKAAGNEAGIPTIQFDLGGMKGSLLGESNANMRTSLKVVEAVSQGRALFIATCNDIKSLPPELRRRFSFGTFFFDLPTAKERDLIWNIYFRKFNLKDKDRPSDIGWTGAEIKNCCDIAWRLKTTLKDAASYIVPLVTSAKERIENLRREADSRFISASEPGPYKAPEGIEELGGVTVVAIGTVPKRRINTEKGGSN
jgi:MoxR-like ATPase